ncbi:MAG TPA: hypothetical protein VME18_02885 [Acidobacteriaceae bacterium]|nr:hypothetical protein [Acidobacteriaceae bacterium]
MNPPQPSDWNRALDEALSEDRDGILPSLGFTDSVMTAVLSQAPAPLRFPWKRALPGLIAGGAALAGFAAAGVRALERMPATAPGSPARDWRPMLEPILQHATSPDTLWTLLALMIPVVTLWLTRRLLFSR